VKHEQGVEDEEELIEWEEEEQVLLAGHFWKPWVGFLGLGKIYFWEEFVYPAEEEALVHVQ
jgi:hypothetical protein